MQNSPRLGIFFYFKSDILGLEKSSISPLPSLGGVLRKKWLRCERRASAASRLRPPCISYGNLIDETFIYQNRLPKVCVLVLQIDTSKESINHSPPSIPPEASTVPLNWMLSKLDVSTKPPLPSDVPLAVIEPEKLV